MLIETNAYSGKIVEHINKSIFIIKYKGKKMIRTVLKHEEVLGWKEELVMVWPTEWV